MMPCGELRIGYCRRDFGWPLRAILLKEYAQNGARPATARLVFLSCTAARVRAFALLRRTTVRVRSAQRPVAPVRCSLRPQVEERYARQAAEPAGTARRRAPTEECLL